MAYLPPFNGGRINASIGGNSTSAGAGYSYISTGNMLLAGGNNITLSQNGSAITISAPNAAAAASQTLGMSNLGNTIGTSGVVSASAVSMAFAGGNNVTLSQSLNGASGTITISAFTQTVQTQSRFNATLAGNSTSAGAGYAQISSGTMTLAGGNNVTLSQNGNAVTVSAFNQTAQTQNLHNLTLAGNSTSAGAGYAQVSSGTLTLAGGNNVTLSQNGNAVTISAANTVAQTVQTQNLVDVTLSGNSTSAGAGYALMSSGTMTLAGGNNVTLSQNGNAVTVSAANQTVQTQNLVDVTLAGNSTSAGAGYALASSGTLTLAGGNNITLSQNGNAVTISAPNAVAQTVQTQNLIDVTLAGNSTSAGAGYALASSGTLTLAGGNNVTLSQNGNAVTVSAFNQTAQTQNLHNLTLAGNSTSAGAGYVHVSSGTLTLAGGNNVTLSQNGNAITVSAFNQSVQSQNLIDVTLAGNSTSAGAGYALASSGTLTLAGGNNVTLSQNGNAVTISAGGGGATFSAGVSNIGNTAGNTGTRTNQLVFAGGNNVTLSQSTDGAGGTVTVSAFNQTAQTQNLHNLTLAGNSTSAGAGYAQISSGTLTLAGGNNVTLSQNGNAVTISAFTQTVQTQNLIDVTLAGNSTSAGGGYALASSGTLTLAGGNNITLSQNGNAVTISAFTQTVQTQSRFNLTLAGNSTSAGAGYAQISSGSMTLAGGNNITLSQNGNAVTISAGAGGGGGVALNGGGTTYTSGTVNFSASGALSITNSTAGGGGQTYQFSAPDQSSLSATGAVSISTNGSTISIGAPQTSSISATGAVSISTNASTISIGAPQNGTVSNWEPLILQHGSLMSRTQGNGSIYFYKLQPQAYVTATQMMELISVTVSSSSNSSHAGVISVAAGIFTANGSTLSLVTDSSGSATYQWSNTSSNSMSKLTGIRGFTIPMNVNMSPGNYWIGMWSRTSFTNAAWFGASNMLFTNVNSAYQNVMLQAANATQGIQEGVGLFSASSSALPTNTPMSQITQSNLSTNAIPYMVFKNTTW